MKKVFDSLRKPELIDIVPIIGLVFLLPLLVFVKERHAEGILLLSWLGNYGVLDFFTYWRSILMDGFALLALGIYFRRKKLPDLLEGRFAIYTIPLLIYALVILASTIGAEYKDIALWGLLDRHEGMFSLLSYCWMCFYSMKMVTTAKQVKWVLVALLTSSFVVLCIGLTQYLGHDIFRTGIGLKLILGQRYLELKDQLRFTSGVNSVYGTLSHYNYMGSFLSLLIPILALLTIGEKSFKKKALYGGLLGFAIFICFNSFARSGLLGICASGFLALILFSRQILPHKRVLIQVVIGIICVTLLLLSTSRSHLQDHLKQTFGECRQLVESFVNPQQSGDKSTLQDISIIGNQIQIVTTSVALKILLDDPNHPQFLDANNQPLNYTMQEKGGKIVFENPVFAEVKVSARQSQVNRKVFIVYYDYRDITLRFVKRENQITLCNTMQIPFQFEPVRKFGFSGAEHFASNRGYIWSRTIPLLKDAGFVGFGPDTFALYFPQHDLMGKSIAFGDMWFIVDKPHNMYLQIAVNTGILALIAVLFLFGAYFVLSIKTYRNVRIKKEEIVYGFALFLACFGYFMVGFVNDSTVCVAPIFWIFLGMGISMNGRVEQVENIESTSMAN